MKVKAPTVILVMSLTIGLAHSAMAQDTQYGQGLFLDYYVNRTADYVAEPTGRSTATLVDTSVPQMSYFVPFEIEPALNQFKDHFWGLHWNGFLKIDDAGPYTFNISINTTAKTSQPYHSVTCLSWLKIQNRIVAGHELQQFFNGNKNAYGDIDLTPGIYNFEIWFSCNELGNLTDIVTANPMLSINMRGPNDAMLKPIPKNQLLHEL